MTAPSLASLCLNVELLEAFPTAVFGIERQTIGHVEFRDRKRLIQTGLAPGQPIKANPGFSKK